MKNLIAAAAAAFALSACATVGGHSGDAHMAHDHDHGADCGHVAVAHLDHVDYLHDGHLHHVHMGHADEHVIAVTEANPDAHAPVTLAHHGDHMHDADDGAHVMIPHGDHMDFLHDGHLHHLHGDHIDEHGPV